jgi:DNA-binding GntR family transcriptional regulator
MLSNVSLVQPPPELLKGVSSYSRQTGLAVGTIRRAIDVLAQEQLVRKVAGRGTFVIRCPGLAPAGR